MKRILIRLGTLLCAAALTAARAQAAPDAKGDAPAVRAEAERILTREIPARLSQGYVLRGVNAYAALQPYRSLLGRVLGPDSFCYEVAPKTLKGGVVLGYWVAKYYEGEADERLRQIRLSEHLRGYAADQAAAFGAAPPEDSKLQRDNASALRDTLALARDESRRAAAFELLVRTRYAPDGGRPALKDGEDYIARRTGCSPQ